MFFPSQFDWDLGDLRVSVGPPFSGQPWLLDVDVARPSTGQVEPMLWDAHSPHGLIRRDAQPWTVPKAAPTPRERDLLILADQGIGDIIQQWRYVDSVAEQFRRARVCCRPELRRLLGRQLPGIEMVTTEQARAAPTDVSVSLMRLGSLCADSIGGHAYLAACPREMRSGRYRLRVGLNWVTSRSGVAADIKSLPVTLLEQVVRNHPDVEWVSVQWGRDEHWLGDQPWAGGIERLGQTFSDVADLADAIAGLDLLITTDSAPAHIAGALGVPVWTLLSNPCSWRWGLDSPTTPLYGTMRLVRQENQGDWSGVVAQVSRMLTGIVRAAGAANFLLARPWEEDDINPFTEAAAKRDAGEAVARSASLDDALRLCREQDNWRAAFVFRPLALLSTLGIRMPGRDYSSLGKVFKAMVDCHGGFSWCSPL